jgi:hypothetical protein
MKAEGSMLTLVNIPQLCFDAKFFLGVNRKTTQNKQNVSPIVEKSRNNEGMNHQSFLLN